VATLDETSPDYNPEFRGQLYPDGRPIYGSKLEDIPDCDLSADGWED
jgi:zinc finger protein BrlA